MTGTPSIPSIDATVASGFCQSCQRPHSLALAGTYAHCLSLMNHLTRYATIDMQAPHSPDPRLATDYLFGKARGKMFGVMECHQQDGSRTVLRAFSGQYNGLWEVPGWAPPLFSTREFAKVNDNAEKQIKALGRELESLPHHSTEWLEIRRQRRQMSRDLMGSIHEIYRLTNYHGHTATLREAYTATGGLATGTGDCCAPKLLNFAARHNLTPLGIAEFYWGRENRAGTRQHGSLYSSCIEKCQPILGYLLCGLNN